MANENKVTGLMTVIVYLIGCLVVSIMYVNFVFTGLPDAYKEYKLFLASTAISMLAGVFYCLRGVYLNYCVKENWASRWIPWYLFRPIASTISGAASFIFLKAGLLVLDAKVQSEDDNYGFFALAFVAGLNVDKFIQKIEELAEVTWGIAKSRSSTNNGQNTN